MARFRPRGSTAIASLLGVSLFIAGCESGSDPGFSFSTGAEGFGYVRPVADHDAVVQGILDLTSGETYSLVNSGGRSVSTNIGGGPRELTYTTARWLVKHVPSGRRFEITQISEAGHARNMVIFEVDAGRDYMRVSEGDAVLSKLVIDANNAFAYWQDPSAFPLRRDRAVMSDG
jgi:hypothetical protein